MSSRVCPQWLQEVYCPPSGFSSGNEQSWNAQSVDGQTHIKGAQERGLNGAGCKPMLRTGEAQLLNLMSIGGFHFLIKVFIHFFFLYPTT